MEKRWKNVLINFFDLNMTNRFMTLSLVTHHNIVKPTTASKSNAMLCLTNQNITHVVLVSDIHFREKKLQMKLSQHLKSTNRLLAAWSAQQQHDHTVLIEILMTCLFQSNMLPNPSANVIFVNSGRLWLCQFTSVLVSLSASLALSLRKMTAEL